MRAKVTWILVADGQRAAVYHHDGPGKGLQAIPELGARHKVPKSSEMMSDNEGRASARAGSSGGAAMTARTDPHELEERRFVEALAKELDQAAAAKRFDQLILAAPPRALGNLRRALSEKTAKLVLAELDKDLTKSTPDNLAKHLAEHLAL